MILRPHEWAGPEEPQSERKECCVASGEGDEIWVHSEGWVRFMYVQLWEERVSRRSTIMSKGDEDGMESMWLVWGQWGDCYVRHQGVIIGTMREMMSWQVNPPWDPSNARLRNEVLYHREKGTMWDFKHGRDNKNGLLPLFPLTTEYFLRISSLHVCSKTFVSFPHVQSLSHICR